MTVQNQTNKPTATTNGVATTFSFSPMVINAASELTLVETVDSTGVETTISQGTGSNAFAVVVSSFPGTGSIRFPEDAVTPRPSGRTLTMKRVLVLEQQTDLTPQGGYFADTQEQQFDRFVMIDLQQQETIDRCLKLPLSVSGVTSETTPGSNAALRVLRINAAGTGVEWAAFSTATASAGSAVPTSVAGAASSGGVATDFAREDHSHQLARAFLLKGADIASADPLVLGTDGNYFDVTGTVGIASLTVATGNLFMLQFDGILVLTHSAVNLNLPGQKNITTAAGDRLIGFATGTNTVHVLSYTRADGTSINQTEGTVASAATTNIWASNHETQHITGTVTITSLGTAPRAGIWRKCIFDDALTLTDGANLNLPGGVNRTTVADDFMWVYAETTTLFKVLYFPVDGTPVIGGANLQEFAGSGTYTKPAGAVSVLVLAWGAGASGGATDTGGNGGGGGGGFNYRMFDAADVGATETTTIGAGGASVSSGDGNTGGNTTFGSLLTAYGGGAGAQDNGGGGGGGALSAGSAGSATVGGAGGGPAGGAGGNGAAGGSVDGFGGGGGADSTFAGGDAAFGGGGGGGRADNSNTEVGGASLYGGGGGGGGDGASAGGVSQFGGNGGAGGATGGGTGTAGTAPGGGGGGADGAVASGAGADGRIEVHTWS